MDDDKLDDILSDINRAVQRFVDEAQMVSVPREVLERALEYLRKNEWDDLADDPTRNALFADCCRECGGIYPKHRDDCERQAAIASIEKYLTGGSLL